MRSKVKVVVAEAHKNQLENSNVQKELTDVQKYFDENTFDWKEETINFVFLRGNYSQLKRTMTVMGVFVNSMDFAIIGLGAKLKLRFTKENAQIATTTVNFPQSFMGELSPNDGLLIHLEIPVKGLIEDCTFNFSDIQGKLENIEVITSEKN